jgi:bifunctional DNA-binding transcriptional regulator/antitoxin component of YhaV-PrlF toxin-antitoxin module
MKEVKILSMDNRGRILIPQSLRNIVGISTDLKLMVVADSELKEIRITAIGLAEAEKLLKLKIIMEDIVGALGKIASTLGDLGISIVYSEGAILEKDKTAIYTAIIKNPDYNLEELKKILIKKGSALNVEITPLE